MNYNFDLGPNAEGVGILWIIAHYFGGLISGLIVLALAGITGYIIYRRYRASRTREFSFVRKESWVNRIMRILF